MDAVLSKKRSQLAVIVLSVLVMTVFMSMFSFSDDAFTMATNLFTNLFTKVWGVAKVLLPCAIGLDICVLFLDHNEKRLGAAKVAFFAMLAAYVILFAISKSMSSNGSGLINDTLDGLGL